MTALALAPQPVMLLTRAPLGLEASSALAQGGIAASLGVDDDAVAASRGYARRRRRAVRRGRRGGHSRRGAGGDRAVGAAWRRVRSRRRRQHRCLVSRPRIRAAGSSMPAAMRTGRDIIRALARKVRRDALDHGAARRRRRGAWSSRTMRLRGVLCRDRRRGRSLFATDRVVIATGGIGGLFLHGTNPAGSFGQGLALAARAGAVMADLEFIQFHPTALDSGSFPLKLISEAVRGEGAILIDERGDRFMAERARRRARAARCRRARGLAASGGRTPGVSRRAERRWAGLGAALPDHHRALPRSRDRSGHAADSDPSRRALSHGRHRRRPARTHVGRRSVGLRRSRLHRPAWRQPARQQFAAGGGGVRRLGRAGYRRNRGGQAAQPRLPDGRRSAAIPLRCVRSCRAPPACLRDADGLRAAARGALSARGLAIRRQATPPSSA